MDQELSRDARLVQPFLRNGRSIKPAFPALKRRAILGQSLRDNKPGPCRGRRLREALDGKEPVWGTGPGTEHQGGLPETARKTTSTAAVFW